jgi:hypothetical protein
MCRPNTLGGRRCPSHSNPVAIANRNARRRAQYATRAGKTIQPETTHLGSIVTRSTTTDAFGNPFAKTEFHGKRGSALLAKTDADRTPYDKLNITHETYAGELVDLNYINAKQVSGVINYTNLDEDSYLEFGFKPIDADGENNRITMTDETDIAHLSEVEIATLTEEEKVALRIFTSSHYRTINRALYAENEDGSLKAAIPDQNASYFEDLDLDAAMEEEYYGGIRYTPEFLTDLTTHIDSAMEKAPHKQRTVYRGMSGANPVFMNAIKQSGYQPNAGTEWVKDNVKLGQEMVFDGYQSSSVDMGIALDYAGGGSGVVYEIITSSGVNATSISAFSHEKEVILPRNARYMVVGVHQGVKLRNYGNMNVIQLVEINEQGAVTEEGNHTPPPALTDKQLRTKTLTGWDF